MRPMLLVTVLAVIAVGGAHSHGRKKRSGVTLPGLLRRSVSSTPQALNPVLTNLIPNGDGGPTLYYNGSGDVPPYDRLSPSPVPLPPQSRQQIEDDVFNQILGIAAGNGIADACSRCIATANVMHLAALTQPVETIVNLLIRSCNQFPQVKKYIYAATCEEKFAGIGNTGAYLAQLFAKMNMATNDMQAYCHWTQRECALPAAITINETQYFKPKPASANVAPTPSGRTIKVLHLSDLHLDPKYDIGSEANCDQRLCCRPYSTMTKLGTSDNNMSVPASRWGYLNCDTPPDLAISAFADMDNFVNRSDIAFTIFTGDIVSHDNDDKLSRDYVEYEEKVVYETFKAWMGKSPIYATLGNHDTLPEAYNTPNDINGNNDGNTNAMSWNYELLSSMWQGYGWIDSSAAQYARTHYGAYSYVTSWGLKVISINTDFWFTDNIFNFYDTTNPDPSGVLTFLAEELQKSEDAGQRAWVIGHVPSGYDVSRTLPNPSALFYSIVVRFSPATIAGVFFGHTHKDQLMIYYDYLSSSAVAHPAGGSGVLRNTTLVDFSKPLMVGYIGPSITPLAGNNAGWTLYEVDSVTFEVVNSQTYIANVSDSNSWTVPEWKLEYDAKATYAPSGWPATAPMNATFWHEVTENMLSNIGLVETYNLYETKSSVATESCSTTACARQMVCSIRSGSALLGRECGN